MDENETVPGTGVADPPAGEPVVTAPPATGSPATALPTDAVRNSPEYRALQEQNRLLARQKGNAEAAAANARQAAETLRLDAEAQAQTAMQTQISELLGADGLATWSEFAELSSTDPVAAARKWAELTSNLTAAQAAAAGGTGVPAVTQQQAPQVPPPPRSLDAGQPLTTIAAPDLDAQHIADLEQTYSATVERNRTAPNRVTERDRSIAVMGYLEAALRKGLKALGG